MKDAKGHGSDKRGGGAERPAPNRTARSFAFKKRKPNPFGGGSGGGGSGGGGGGGNIKHKTGVHGLAVHKAASMNLAQLSAAATNQNIPPPIIGGRK